MNFFNGFGGLFGKRHCGHECNEGGDNCLCTIILIIFLLQMCGCGGDMDFDCCDIILLLLLLTCLCGNNENRNCCQ